MLQCLVSSCFFVALSDFSLHICLFGGIGFFYFQIFVVLFSPECSDVFIIWLFYYFYLCSFSLIRYKHREFLNFKFNAYVFAEDSAAEF